MLKKIQQSFNNLITPDTGAYPWIDRALGLIPFAAGIVVSIFEANKADTEYHPLTKQYAYAGLPIVAGVYGATQVGLTYAKAGIEKIENTSVKGVADFVVGLIDTWNNIPLYVYSYNMLPEKWNANSVLAFKYLPVLVNTIEGDIKALVKGGEYDLNSWTANTAFVAGAIAKNIASAVSDPLKGEKTLTIADVENIVDKTAEEIQAAINAKEAPSSFDSVVVGALISGGLYKVLTSLLDSNEYKAGEFSSVAIKSACEDALYEMPSFRTINEKVFKADWIADDGILGKSSALGGPLLHAAAVETLFYLLNESDALLDHTVGSIKALCDEYPELYNSAASTVDGSL